RVVPSTVIFQNTGDIAGQPFDGADLTSGPVYESWREGLPVNETITARDDTGSPVTLKELPTTFSPPATRWPAGISVQVSGNVATIRGSPGRGSAGGYLFGIDAIPPPGDFDVEGLGFHISVLDPLISFSPGTAAGTGIYPTFTGSATFTEGVANSLTITAS